MYWFFDLLSNRFLMAGVISWLIAQILKTVIHFAVYKKLEVERLFGDGGMPSGHSATVAAVCTMCGLSYGLGSVEFAISAILAIIVCHDAMGVRRETGKQAFILNEIIKAFEELSEEALPEVKLKEFVGHTPIQVTAGILIGIGNGFLMWLLLFG